MPSTPTAVSLKLADVLLEQGSLEEAQAAYERVVKLAPADARANAGLGRVAYRRGDLARARQLLAASIAGAPGARSTYALQAEVLLRLGDGAAAEATRRAMASLPESFLWPDPYWQQVTDQWTGALASIERASNLYAGGQVAEAIRFLRDTAARYPGAVLVHLSLGRFLLQSGDTAGAEESLRRAVALAPGSFEAHFELGSALQAENKSADALAALLKTIELKPDYPPAHFQLAQHRLRGGDRRAAIESLRAAVRYRPSYSQAHRDLGRELFQTGEQAEGLEHLRSAVQLNPADREAARLLAAAESLAR